MYSKLKSRAITSSFGMPRSSAKFFSEPVADIFLFGGTAMLPASKAPLPFQLVEILIFFGHDALEDVSGVPVFISNGLEN
jgi:hypothetical protein